MAISVLRAVIVAALVAGAALAAFQYVLGEPIVDRAIAREEAKHQGEDHGQEVFTRRAQKLGLAPGALTYGLALGLVFGGVYALAGERLPGGTPRRRALVLAAAGLWVLFIAPFVKYPGNPPGVGSPDTVYERQAFYVVFLTLSVLGLIVAGLFGRSLRRGGARALRAAAAALGAYVLFFVALYVLMPGNPDPNDAPASLIWQFRTVSVTGSVVFWMILGLLFGRLMDQSGQEAGVGGARGRAALP